MFSTLKFRRLNSVTPKQAVGRGCFISSVCLICTFLSFRAEIWGWGTAHRNVFLKCLAWAGHEPCVTGLVALPVSVSQVKLKPPCGSQLLRRGTQPADSVFPWLVPHFLWSWIQVSPYQEGYPWPFSLKLHSTSITPAPSRRAFILLHSTQHYLTCDASFVYFVSLY